MSSKLDLLKLSFCGPGDVLKEIGIGREVVDQWNLTQGEARGLWIKAQNWKSDSHPELGDRPQAIINRQLIDASDIIVAIFWQRFGSPTGVAESGTEEEILRAEKAGRKVMVYFSDLEAIQAGDQAQVEKLWQFRQRLRPRGITENFSSRQGFREMFTRQLAFAVNSLRPSPTPKSPLIIQNATGSGNIQAAGNVTINQKLGNVKNVLPRRADSISRAEALEVKGWVNELVDATTGMARDAAFGMWWSRYTSRFKVNKYEELPATDFLTANRWFIEQRAILTRSLKSKLPEEWRKSRYGAIKAAMKSMGKTNESYYSEIATRLRMKKSFVSLTKLTKKDLERVYVMVLRDAKGG